MEVEELRIGNFVKVINDKALFLKKGDCKVHGIHYGCSDIFGNQHQPEIHAFNLDSKNVGSGESRLFEGIPITEEWLVKFGFELGNDEQFTLKHSNGITHSITFRFCFVDSDVFGDFWIGKGDERLLLNTNYVHQLQSLYFALTGEELSIKS